MRDLQWTPDDCRAACAEGWCIFNGDEIQRDDELSIFATDDRAIHHIRGSALDGSRLHQKALLIDREAHPDQHPTEYPWETLCNACNDPNFTCPVHS